MARGASPRESKDRATADEDPQEPVGEIAGDANGALIADQLVDERSRKDSFERRALAVITSAGVVVSLLLGLAPLVHKPPAVAQVCFAVALGLFAVAAALGIIASVPRRYQETAPEHLWPLLEDRFWYGRASIGKRRVAELRLNVLDWARGTNDGLGQLLVWALSLELAALVAVAVAVGSLVLER